MISYTIYQPEFVTTRKVPFQSDKLACVYIYNIFFQFILAGLSRKYVLALFVWNKKKLSHKPLYVIIFVSSFYTLSYYMKANNVIDFQFRKILNSVFFCFVLLLYVGIRVRYPNFSRVSGLVRVSVHNQT
jgi:hypothetical protein